MAHSSWDTLYREMLNSDQIIDKNTVTPSAIFDAAVRNNSDSAITEPTLYYLLTSRSTKSIRYFIVENDRNSINRSALLYNSSICSSIQSQYKKKM
jgi:hypothetical protein